MASNTQQSGTSRGGTAPLHAITTVGFADFLAGFKIIGVVGANYLIHRVVVDITTAFDAGATLSVGILSSQGIIMTVSENDLSLVSTVEKEPNYRNLTSQQFSAYLIGAPTQGSATVYLYYS